LQTLRPRLSAFYVSHKKAHKAQKCILIKLFSLCFVCLFVAKENHCG
jgi:hypothetical protein